MMLRSRPRVGRFALVLVAFTHLALTCSLWVSTPAPLMNGWIQVDDLGLLFLSILSLLFLMSSLYALGYLRIESEEPHRDLEESFLFINAPEAVFIGCLLFFLAAMTLVTTAQHLGLLWVGVEATTLASAPLIYYHRHHHSLEATWKYLMICSVGIALALLGNFVLSVAVPVNVGHSNTLLAGELTAHADTLDRSWLMGAFLFFLVGYGTKMGLAPMHTWLPDAHSQAPSLVSALLSGALLNCAFLGILRVQRICVAAGVGEQTGNLLVVFGLISMGVASVFIVVQSDFKRLLAYSSVEHMGILALAVGMGASGAYGAFLHSINHSLTKATLFLVAGMIMTAYKTREIQHVQGVMRVIPATGILWIAAIFAITGMPPFGVFLSEFTVLVAAVEGGRIVVTVLYLLFLSMIFIGMVSAMLKMTQGKAPENIDRTQIAGSRWMVFAPAVLLTLVLILGVFIPPPVNDLAMRASREFDFRPQLDVVAPPDVVEQSQSTPAIVAKDAG